VRNSFLYSDFNKEKLLNALLNISSNVDFISILSSNLSKDEIPLPLDYITYDLIAGIGSLEILNSNENSFNKLNDFQTKHSDWLFGCLSYDLKNEVEALESNNNDNFPTDNMLFFIPEYVLMLKDGVLEIQTFNHKKVCDEFIFGFNFEELKTKEFDCNIKQRDTKEAYVEKIKKIKNHIQLGDIYEMNYCQEFYATDVSFSAESVFSELNNKMQTPFSSFLKLEKKYILSASPERFLRKQGNKILSQPIKGTRKRGVSKKEDEVLISALKTSSKDISENVMITDLVRNDLSITAKIASVKVKELCEVYTFEKVHQMITTVSSEVDSDTSFAEVLKSAFPMGSMTGAPKIRAMELIEEFEEFKRGIFSGAVGYITPSSDFDFNVVIRTILYNLATNYLSVGVGGAITIKSDEQDEYEECLIKVKPIFDVLNFTLNDK